MKKLTYLVALTSSLFLIAGNASESFDIKKVNLPKEFNTSEKIITEDECIKFLGEENYKFIVEVYSDNTAAILKCKEEMRK